MAARIHTLYRDIDVPQHLAGTIVHRIARERRRAARFKLAALGAGLFASCAALVPALFYLASEWRASGFGDYLALAFSGGMAHWQSLTFSLFEALPSLAILFVFAIGAVVLWSLRGFVRTARIALPLFA